MTRDQRYDQLQRIAHSKNGMLQLQALRQRLRGPTPVCHNDSLEKLINEILDAEFATPPLDVIVLVGGATTSLDALRWETSNFGQFRYDYPVDSYVLKVARSEFARRLERDYEQCLAELKHDDSIGAPGCECSLRDVGYPPMQELLNTPVALAEAVQTYMWDDFLGAFLQPSVDRGYFLINSIDSVVATADLIEVSGQGYYLNKREG